ncbi:methionyl-tRNA formyltransferase [Hyphomicrobium sp. D-2]|uniref:methionyl-tRNA formyltransferase n=1 Tax=Hyphomicrobium sp. D-2 TaxID=3041621 RepID=UPI002454328C|nr:methionyl-tRNA formyltransferase [Hyphomicrobium sp. D-2]MDH4982218.1 methionyl-tRNA formyltransferase [Hyphomicrobium sp. D-2]
MSLRIIFMGTPEFAVPTLAEIVGAGHEVVAAYSQPPRAAGRGMAERKSPVQVFAEAAGIPVFTPTRLRDADQQAIFAEHNADAAVVVAYGLLLPQPILDGTRLGCYNLHPSILPRWRGAAPIQRAVMAGDADTAATIMRMEAGLDTGPVCLAEPVAIAADETAGELHDVLAARGASAMVRALAALERGTLDCQPQSDDGILYADKIDKAESRIDFARSARDVHNLIRGISPFPGAWFEVERDGKRERFKVLRSQLVAGRGAPGEVLDEALTVACGDGAIRIVELQRAGKKPMPVVEVLRGFPIPPGTRL